MRSLPPQRWDYETREEWLVACEKWEDALDQTGETKGDLERDESEQ